MYWLLLEWTRMMKHVNCFSLIHRACREVSHRQHTSSEKPWRIAYIFLHELILIPCFSCSHRGQEKGVIHAVSPLYFSFQRVTITVQESMEEIHWTLHICPRVRDEQSCVFWWNTSHRLSSRRHTLPHAMSLKLVSIRGILLFRYTDTWKTPFKSAWGISSRVFWSAQRGGLGHNRMPLKSLQRFSSRNKG